MSHDPDTVRQIAEHAHSQAPWYSAWFSQIAAGAGIVSLWLLKFIGSKELARRESYVTQDSMDKCKTDIIEVINDADDRNDRRVRELHERIDNHLDKCP